MKIISKNKVALIEAASGKRPCDLLIKNVQLVNVITGEIYKASVGVYDGFIAHVACNPEGVERKESQIIAKEVVDGEGKYLIPGLIDAHIHIESSMMTPQNFAKAVIPHGTTTVVTDPHEIANVYGLEAVEYMYDASEELPMRQYILMPSCVPAVPEVENAGAAFGVEEVSALINRERLFGLAEVMDYVGVMNGDVRMMDILNVFEEKNMFIQGHAPWLYGSELSAYLCGGATSCHETRTPQETRDKMRYGMYVDARDSSISKDVATLVQGIKDFRYTDYFTMCTDDREADEILEAGHMNDVVNRAIAAGMHPIDAIRSATLNIARELEIKNLGAIAPGYVADMLLVDSIENIQPECVWYGGKLVAKNRKLLATIPSKTFELETRNSVYVDDIVIEDLWIKAPIENGTVKVNVLKYPSLDKSQTVLSIEELPVKDGYLDISHDEDLRYVAIINRHRGHHTKAVAVVRGYGIKKGIQASTISHDSHNLTIIYDKAEDALVAIQRIKENRGGMVSVKDGKVIGELVLAVAGLMSTKDCEALAKECSQMKGVLKTQGLTVPINPLLRIVTLALPVIPEVKMSDKGIVHVPTKTILPVFVNH